MKKYIENPKELPGATNERYIKGYKEHINSKHIISFEYDCLEFHVSCKLLKDKLQITSTGGNGNVRDGSAFKLDYKTNNLDLLKDLQIIVTKYNLSKNNGHELKVNGLPAGLGDMLSITYDTNEKIYHYSNQSHTISTEASSEIYELFHKSALNNNYDFTTNKSNQIIYDDATEEFLQGKWKGTHFGKEIITIFDNNHIKIYVDNKLTDDIDYIIIEGNIRPNKLKSNVTKPKNEYDYEEFNGLSSIRKKNNILLTAYFTKDSYSTADLLIQKSDH